MNTKEFLEKNPTPWKSEPANNMFRVFDALGNGVLKTWTEEEAQAICDMANAHTSTSPEHRANSLTYEESAIYWHAEVVRLREDAACCPAKCFPERMQPPWLQAVMNRLAEAEVKHPRDDWEDGTDADAGENGLREVDRMQSYADIENRKSCLDEDERDGVARWMSILLCEVHELACETSDDRIMDELLDVIVVALRWYGVKARKAGR